MVNLDTEQVKKCGQDMMKLSKDLSKIIDALYLRLYNMSLPEIEKTDYMSGIWLGNAAEYFSKYANNVEKKDALTLANTLYKYGEVLEENALAYEKEILKKN